MPLLSRSSAAATAAALLAVLAGLLGPPELWAQSPRPPANAALDAPVRYDTDFLPPAFHRERREAVVSALPRDAVAIVLGGAEAGGALDDLREFTQDPYLYYLTGTNEPGSALLLVPGGVEVDGRRVREILFVPSRDPATEIWLGRRFGPERAEQALGIELALPQERFGEIVDPLVAQDDRPAYLLPFPTAVPPTTELADQIGVLAEAAQARTKALDDFTLTVVLDGLREVKTDEEIALMRRAADITCQALSEAIGAMEPGWAEYEIEAVIEYTFRRLGSERPGFPSIVGSGENSLMLHYDTNRRTTRAGDLVVMDVGASYRGYTADVTRTVPVDGRFTPEQRAIYDIVLEAQKAGIAAAKAGASFGAPGEVASRILARGLARLGLLDGPEDFDGLRRFFPHGTSHYLGLQVHDVGSYRALAAGVVITVEPGVYIAPAEDISPRWWNIGIRIEDDVLVTDGKPVVLSAGVPKDPEEIETLMAGGPAGPAR